VTPRPSSHATPFCRASDGRSTAPFGNLPRAASHPPRHVQSRGRGAARLPQPAGHLGRLFRVDLLPETMSALRRTATQLPWCSINALVPMAGMHFIVPDCLVVNRCGSVVYAELLMADSGPPTALLRPENATKCHDLIRRRSTGEARRGRPIDPPSIGHIDPTPPRGRGDSGGFAG
jgi:hypothetical protein